MTPETQTKPKDQEILSRALGQALYRQGQLQDQDKAQVLGQKKPLEGIIAFYNALGVRPYNGGLGEAEPYLAGIGYMYIKLGAIESAFSNGQMTGVDEMKDALATLYHEFDIMDAIMPGFFRSHDYLVVIASGREVNAVALARDAMKRLMSRIISLEESLQNAHQEDERKINKKPENIPVIYGGNHLIPTGIPMGVKQDQIKS